MIARTRTVTLALQATDEAPGMWVYSMRIKNAGGNWSTCQPYAESKRGALTRGAGNVSVKASDSIIYRP